MSALLITQPDAGTLKPVNLPRLRAVSTRTPIDVPALTVTQTPATVDVHEIAPVREDRLHNGELTGLERLVTSLKVGVLVAASVTFALGLELWLTF